MTKIAVSSGDPAGVGPDICIKAFGSRNIQPYFPVIFGNIGLFKDRAKLLDIDADIQVYDGEDVNDLTHNSRWMVDQPIEGDIIPGTPSSLSAQYTISLFKESVERTISKEFDAIVTCPINKEVINKGGIPFTGHTEELARMSNVNKVVMMLVNENMKVALASTHIPLSEVSSAINHDFLIEIISIIDNSLKLQWNIKKPFIKVLGLNPHAGDGGFIGKEEEEIISPAIETLKKNGLNIIGPISADTAFVEKDNEKADAFLAMFHDQGLPVIKTMSFGEIVNITLGLPFIRTSVDHGTAYDVAGSIFADETSLLTASKMAHSISNRIKNA